MKRNGLRTLLTMIVTLVMVLSVAFSPALAGAEGAGDGTGEDVNLGSPDVHKWLTDADNDGKPDRDGDGNYTLNLSVTGKSASRQESEKVDVIFVLDTSGSMKDPTYTYYRDDSGTYGLVDGSYVLLDQDYRTGKLTYTYKDASGTTHEYFTSEGYHEDAKGKFGTTDGENYVELTIADDGTVTLPDGSPYYNKDDDGSLGKVGDQYVQLYYYNSYYESYVEVQDYYYGSGLLYYQKSDGTYVPYDYMESKDGKYGIVDGNAIELQQNSSGEWGYWDYYWNWHTYAETRYTYSAGDRYTPGQRYSHHEKTGDLYSRQPNSTTRLTSAQNAIKTAANAVLADGDTRVSLITFANDAKDNSSWHSREQTVDFNNLVDGQRANGGTNWEAALRKANAAAAASKDEGRTPYVVFVSDGAPTRYLDDYGRVQGTGEETDSNISTCLGQAVDYAPTLRGNVAGLYCVNAFGDAKNMQDLGGTYLEADADNIDSTFRGIAAAIKKDYTYKNVTITDTLSGDMVTGGSDSAITSDAIPDGYEIDANSFRYTVIDTNDNDTKVLDSVDKPDGKYVTNGAVASVDASGRPVVTWQPMGDGALVGGYKYVVSFKVKLTQEAYDDAAKLANNTITAGGNLKEDGSVYSNTDSGNQASYDRYLTTKGTERKLNGDVPETANIDDRPTIPVPVSQITITKHWNGDAPKPTPLTVNVKDDAYNKTTGSIFDGGTRAVTLSDAGDTWTTTLYVAAGPDGHKYTATEVVPTGWKQSVPADNAGVTIDWPNKLDAQNGSAEFTNEPKTVTLTVRKNLTGDQADTTKSFDVSAKKDGEDAKTDTIRDTTADGIADDTDTNVATFTYNYGDTVTVTEGGVLGYPGYSTTSAATGGSTATGGKAITVTLNGDTTVTFTNDKTPVPITGIASGDHSIPTLLGILAAAGVAIAGGFALVQSRMSAEAVAGEHVGSRSWRLGRGSAPRHGRK